MSVDGPIAGLRPTGRRLAGPAADLVELETDKGLRHTAIVFRAEHRDHRALTDAIDVVEGFLESPMVVGLLSLTARDRQLGAFVYPTGSCWSVAETIRILADTGEPAGVRAGLELLFAAGQILSEASDIGQAEGVYSHGNVNPFRLLIKPDGQVMVIGHALPPVEIIAYNENPKRMPREDAFRYCPPERLADQPEDIHSDLFCLALVAFELMTGRPVYDGLVEEIRQQAARGEGSRRLFRFRDRLPENVLQILSRAIKPDPQDRYEDAEAFLEAVRVALSKPSCPGPALMDVMARVADATPRLAGHLDASATAAMTKEDLRRVLSEEGAAGRTPTEAMEIATGMRRKPKTSAPSRVSVQVEPEPIVEPPAPPEQQLEPTSTHVPEAKPKRRQPRRLREQRGSLEELLKSSTGGSSPPAEPEPDATAEPPAQPEPPEDPPSPPPQPKRWGAVQRVQATSDTVVPEPEGLRTTPPPEALAESVDEAPVLPPAGPPEEPTSVPGSPQPEPTGGYEDEATVNQLFALDTEEEGLPVPEEPESEPTPMAEPEPEPEPAATARPKTDPRARAKSEAAAVVQAILDSKDRRGSEPMRQPYRQATTLEQVDEVDPLAAPAPAVSKPPIEPVRSRRHTHRPAAGHEASPFARTPGSVALGRAKHREAFRIARGPGTAPVTVRLPPGASVAEAIGQIVGRVVSVRMTPEGQLSGWFRLAHGDRVYGGRTAMRQVPSEPVPVLHFIRNRPMEAAIDTPSGQRIVLAMGTAVPLGSVVDHLAVHLQLDAGPWALELEGDRLGPYDIMDDVQGLPAFPLLKLTRVT